MSLAIALLAVLVELTFGYPRWLYRRIGHPVVWIGHFVDLLDTRLNRPDGSPDRARTMGILALAVLIMCCAAIAQILTVLAGGRTFGWVVATFLAASLIAQRSLAAHVGAVAKSLKSGGVDAGREAVGRIVGRDTVALDESGVSRAAIESLAENFSDGVVAPVFWMTIAGLPGIVVYKAINTADSMIGHKTGKHVHFGRATARFDDLVNLPAARLTAFFVMIAAAFVPRASAAGAWKAVWRDARRHRSPNAGWPEAAFAGALGLELAGPREYGGKIVDDAIMGAGGRKALTIQDIRQALRLYWTADLLMIVALSVAVGLAYSHL